MCVCTYVDVRIILLNKRTGEKSTDQMRGECVTLDVRGGG